MWAPFRLRQTFEVARRRSLSMAPRLFPAYGGCMKLKQAQTWKCGDEFVRIVDLQRLEVGYKTFKSLNSSTGTHQRTSKKAFCRMLKNATLVTGETDDGNHRRASGPHKFAPKASHAHQSPMEPVVDERATS